MSEEQAPPGPRDRKRPAPTIDLRATEVAGAGSADAKQRQPAAPGPLQQTYQHLSEYLRMTFSGNNPDRPDQHFPWRLLGAGAAGLALAGILVLLAWMAGRDSGRDALQEQLAGLERQVREFSARPALPSVDSKITDELAGRVGKLEAASPTPTPDPKTADPKTVDPKTVDPKIVDDLTGRVTQLEAASAAPRPIITDSALTNRVAALENEFKSFDEKAGVTVRRTDELGATARDIANRNNEVAKAIADLSQKVAEIPPPPVGKSDLEAVTGRIGVLERTATAVEAELVKRAAIEPGDRAARLAMFAAALDASTVRGEPLAASLAAVKEMGADPTTLAALEPFASTGVPAATALGRELLTLLPALAKSIGTPARDGGILDRLAANAEKLVRVRPVEDASGDDPSTLLARIEARATQSDIAGALTVLGQLPMTARPIVAQWITKAEARVAALSASRQLALDTLAALGKGR